MEEKTTFSYTYSANENKEIQEIRKRYLPQSENTLDELKRLDHLVQTSGVLESISTGVIGALIFGVGMCLAMQVIGGGGVFMGLGMILGIIGIFTMIVAYPIYRKVFAKTKAKFTPRILEITNELSENYTGLG